MADAELPDPGQQVKPGVGVPPEVEPSPRASVRDTIEAIEAELARHEPSTSVALSDPEI